MRTLYTLTTFAAICAMLPSVSAYSAEPGAVLVSRDVIELPAFEKIVDRPLIHLYAPEDDYVRSRADVRYTFERLTYMSDGLKVIALLYRPTRYDDPLPAIVFNRGSYVRNDVAPEYLVSFHRLAEAGYSILAPMYRGSDGGEGRDEMGGADLNDLMTIAALTRDLPSVDSKRLFLLGESRGGMMVLQAIREGFPAHAAAIYGSPTDFYRLLDSNPDQYEAIADQLWPEWRTDTDNVIGRRSAVKWARKIDIPILIMHGGKDRSMPVTQSLALADRLQELNKTYELHIFGYENHVISGKASERDALAVAWFEKHVAD